MNLGFKPFEINKAKRLTLKMHKEPKRKRGKRKVFWKPYIKSR